MAVVTPAHYAAVLGASVIAVWLYDVVVGIFWTMGRGI